jgi:hypothetical protein
MMCSFSQHQRLQRLHIVYPISRVCFPHHLSPLLNLNEAESQSQVYKLISQNIYRLFPAIRLPQSYTEPFPLLTQESEPSVFFIPL